MANFKLFSTEFRTKPIYTKMQMANALKKQAKELTVNRVVKSFNGRYGPDCTKAMKILAIHNTPEGVLVVVEE